METESSPDGHRHRMCFQCEMGGILHHGLGGPADHRGTLGNGGQYQDAKGIRVLFAVIAGIV